MNAVRAQPLTIESRTVRTPILPEEAATDIFPLSFAQEGLWFMEQFAPGNATYNIPEGWWLRGRVERDALQKALDAVVARHETLRTTLGVREDRPVQIIGPPRPFALTFKDVSRHKEAELEARRLAEEEARRPFELRSGPLARGLLVRTGEEEHLFVLNLHHIISDAWSVGVFLNELAAHYQAVISDSEPRASELSIQFTDFSEWQRESWQKGLFAEQEAYWTSRLRAPLASLALPTDHPRLAVQSFKGQTIFHEWPESLLEELKRFSREHGVTLFISLLAAFKTLLHRYSRQEEIMVGSPLAGRERMETEGLIGFFANTLPLRTDLSGDPSFLELLKRVRETALGAQSHPDVPFEKLVGRMVAERDLGCSSVFQAVFGLQKDFSENWALPGITVTRMDLESGTAKFDWTLLVTESRTGLKLRLEFNADIFEAETARRWVEQLRILLERAMENPAPRLSEFSLVSEDERKRVISEFNGTRTEYESDQTVAELFESRARENPDAVALIFGTEELSYGELNAQTNALAMQLEERGVGHGTMVGLCIERSCGMIIAMLAILKASGAYVPLDASYPAERLEFMVQDTGARIVLTQRKLQKALLNCHANIIAIEELTNSGADHAYRADPGHSTKRATADSLAYVIYTSGSTGLAKGVAVPHRGIVRLVRNTNYVSISREDIFLQLAPISFDASTFEIWGALLNGAKLHIFPPHLPSLEELGRTVKNARITTLWLTAGLFNQMVEEQLEHLKGVRQLLAGGEALSVPHVQRALKELTGCQIINGYGPTENTTFTCCHRVPRVWPGGMSVPIGGPISNTQTYILDAHFSPVPVGMPGELCIGGDGLAQGYVNRPELTAEKFIVNPFSRESGCQKLYRTGDLARWRADGTIEFLGRMDEQLKIRGYRVEPAEIEAVLTQHSDLSQATVVARADKSGNRHLVAYVVPKGGRQAERAEIRTFASAKLPPYMVPSQFVVLQSMPLTVNGKVDRRALPAPESVADPVQCEVQASKNETERRVLEIWRDLLGREAIGTQENFFHLGGHSLLATQVISRVGKVFGIELSVRAIFEKPTVIGLAREIIEAQRTGMVRPPEIRSRLTQSQAADLLARLDELTDQEVEELLQETELNQP